VQSGIGADLLILRKAHVFIKIERMRRKFGSTAASSSPETSMPRRESFRSARLPALFVAIACGFLALPVRAQDRAAPPTTPAQLLEPVNATPDAALGDPTQAGPTTPVNPAASGSGTPERTEHRAAPAQDAAIPDTSKSDAPRAAASPDDSVAPEIPAVSEPSSSASPEASPGAAPASPAVASPNPAPAPAATSPSPTAVQATSPALVGGDLIKAALDALLKSEGKDTELRKEYAALAAYYAARNDAPLWVENGKPIDAVAPAMARLARAGGDGLDLSERPAPVFEGAPDKLAAADVALSAEVVAYGRQASGSRVDPQAISGLIGAKPDLPDPALILAAVAAAATDSGAMLQSFNPQQKSYVALRDKLVELRDGAKSGKSGAIPPGRPLRVGMHDPRVPLLRARFGLEQTGVNEFLYDGRVAAAVAGFQRQVGLPPSGVLTAHTIATLADPVRAKNEIIANMEFWRWMPRQLGATRIEVNIPDFTASVVEDGEVIERHKVIVGKPDTPTPIFSNAIKFLIVNPAWNVPPSIIRKEMLPHLAADPNYLSEMGYEAFMQNGRLVVRQPPGERNALGLIKFMFPNQYSVYLHDTPMRSLFTAERRAFSHGCVRIDQPFELAQTVLGPRWPEAKIKGLIGGEERYVYLPKPLPIYIEYFTAFVDDVGHLQLRDDLYGYSRKVKLALGLESEDVVASTRD
jgi:murein L,D-transpeptidase YcbB/YkuD